MADGEYHVASFVVSIHPEHSTRVVEYINSMPGLEVHAEERGKLVVTAEASNVRELAKTVGDLELVDAVIAVAPIYHEYIAAQESVAAGTVNTGDDS